MQGGDNSLDLGLIGAGGPRRTHVDLASTRGRHDLGNVVGAQAARDEDDDVLSPALDQARQRLGLSSRRVATSRQHAVIAQLHEDVEAPILIEYLVEAPVEGQGCVLGDVAQSSSRVHVNGPIVR